MIKKLIKNMKKPRTINVYRQSKEYGSTEPSPSKELFCEEFQEPNSKLSDDEWYQLTNRQIKLMRDEGLRVGQSYMNALFMVRTDLYDIINGDEELDCYYSDNKVLNLIRYLNE